MERGRRGARPLRPDDRERADRVAEALAARSEAGRRCACDRDPRRRGARAGRGPRWPKRASACEREGAAQRSPGACPATPASGSRPQPQSRPQARAASPPVAEAPPPPLPSRRSAAAGPTAALRPCSGVGPPAAACVSLSARGVRIAGSCFPDHARAGVWNRALRRLPRRFPVRAGLVHDAPQGSVRRCLPPSHPHLPADPAELVVAEVRTRLSTSA